MGGTNRLGFQANKNFRQKEPLTLGYEWVGGCVGGNTPLPQEGYWGPSLSGLMPKAVALSPYLGTLGVEILEEKVKIDHLFGSVADPQLGEQGGCPHPPRIKNKYGALL